MQIVLVVVMMIMMMMISYSNQFPVCYYSIHDIIFLIRKYILHYRV